MKGPGSRVRWRCPCTEKPCLPGSDAANGSQLSTGAATSAGHNKNYSCWLELTGASAPTPSLPPKVCIIFRHHKGANKSHASYGLNGHIPQSLPLSPSFIYWKLPIPGRFRTWRLGMWLGWKDCTMMERMVSLEAAKEMRVLPSIPWGSRVKMSSVGKGGTAYARALIWDFPASRTLRNKFLVFTPLNLQCCAAANMLDRPRWHLPVHSIAAKVQFTVHGQKATELQRTEQPALEVSTLVVSLPSLCILCDLRFQIVSVFLSSPSMLQITEYILSEIPMPPCFF